MTDMPADSFYDPPPGSAIDRELANAIAARRGRIDTRTTFIEGDLS
jgi:hypothetical protein